MWIWFELDLNLNSIGFGLDSESFGHLSQIPMGICFRFLKNISDSTKKSVSDTFGNWYQVLPGICAVFFRKTVLYFTQFNVTFLLESVSDCIWKSVSDSVREFVSESVCKSNSDFDRFSPAIYLRYRPRIHLRFCLESLSQILSRCLS